MMESLDPRIQRLERSSGLGPKEELDQLETFEVFVQLKSGKPYRHEGIVHASDLDMAFLFAKEQFSRRQTCTGIWVARTSDVFVSDMTDGDENVYSRFEPADVTGQNRYEVFHLLKRGKQHVHAGSVQADNIESAYQSAAGSFGETFSYNVWIVADEHLLRSDEEDIDIWSTLPEKKFRDALAYRAGDRLKEFLEKNKQ